ncbi:hypothetical protein Agub_g9551, partial [Astrephomene gubernaculifera]
ASLVLLAPDATPSLATVGLPQEKGLAAQIVLHLDPASGNRLLPCTAGSSCVSTANFLSPSQYLPPWSFDPLTSQQAKRQLLDELVVERGGIVVREDEPRGYIAAVVPYKLGPGRQQQPWDLLEFVFASEGRTVTFRSEALPGGLPGSQPLPGLQLPAVPPRPFCWTLGCVTGPGNRGRLEALRDSLGWSSLETDEDKSWVPFLLHD